jgi:hypothetical protein
MVAQAVGLLLDSIGKGVVIQGLDQRGRLGTAIQLALGFLARDRGC